MIIHGVINELERRPALEEGIQNMNETETKELVESTILQLGASSMKDMGKVMGFINKKYAGQIDGSVVAKFVKEKLS